MKLAWDELAEGMSVSVTETDGFVTRGVVIEAAPKALWLVLRSGDDCAIDRDEIVAVETSGD